MTLPFDRSTVRELLIRWQRADAAWQDTEEAAEAFLEGDLPELRRHGEDSITREGMEIAARIDTDYLVRSDVPALLQFIDTARGDEAAGWQALDAFFAAIDFDARAQTWPEGA
ncbi:MAG: hypothetical protein M3Q66_04620 [Chloroflexota bacterium]|nr:hypothetical protein [Chloroflexota bacterium]